MSRLSTLRILKSKNIPAILIIAVVVAVLGGRAISAQDKYTVQDAMGRAARKLYPSSLL